MSLDRSPSPMRDGGWSTPGLTENYNSANGRSRGPSPAKKTYGELNGDHGVTWARAQANSARFKPEKQGFFNRHIRKMSQGLPIWGSGGQDDRYAEKEKLQRGRLGRGSWKDVPRILGRLAWRMRGRAAIALLFVIAVVVFYASRE